MSAGDLLLPLRPGWGVPLHRQIETSLRGAIRTGRLPRGGRSCRPRGGSRAGSASRAASSSRPTSSSSPRAPSRRIPAATPAWRSVGSGLPSRRCPCAPRRRGSTSARAGPTARSPARRAAALDAARARCGLGRGFRVRQRARRASPSRRAGRVPGPCARHVRERRGHRNLQRLRAGHRARRPDAGSHRRDAAGRRGSARRRRRRARRARGRPRRRRRPGRRARRPDRRARTDRRRRARAHPVPPVADRGVETTRTRRRA